MGFGKPSRVSEWAGARLMDLADQPPYGPAAAGPVAQADRLGQQGSQALGLTVEEPGQAGRPGTGATGARAAAAARSPACRSEPRAQHRPQEPEGGGAPRKTDSAGPGAASLKGRGLDRTAALPSARRAARRGNVRLRDWRHHEQVLHFLKANYLAVRFAAEIFSGSGNFSATWRWQVGLPIIEFDIRHGDEHDLTLPQVQKMVRGRALAPFVITIWMGTPCSSFSRSAM